MPETDPVISIISHYQTGHKNIPVSDELLLHFQLTVAVTSGFMFQVMLKLHTETSQKVMSIILAL